MTSSEMHSDDYRQFRHGRSRNDGFAVGRYLQPAPMLFSRDGHNLFLGDMYRGHSAFLICAGPSLLSHDLSQLDQRGILTCSVNNAATVYRPHLWTSADDPGNFCDAIWRDPGITKFVPICHMEKTFNVRSENGALVKSQEVVGDMPNVYGFRRNESFNADTWLYEDSFNWGNHSQKTDSYGNKGSRSIMYIALRLLFFLGVRRVFLLGCDFRMENGQRNYAFDQDRSKASVSGNNSSYEIMNIRFERLLPHFEREGFQVLNCTPNSGLRIFPHIPFEQAISDVRSSFPPKIETWGMYDGKAKVVEKKHSSIGSEPKRESQVPKSVPPMTLVVGLQKEDLDVWPFTWETWKANKPWVTNLPLLVIHPPELKLSKEQFTFLNDHPQFELRPSSIRGPGCAKKRMQSSFVKIPAQYVSTPWYLKLDPKAIAVNQRPWIGDNWFAPSESSCYPAFISCPWGYAKPLDAIERLNAWADKTPQLAQYPSVEIPFSPDDDRVRFPTINSWCFFGRTDWTKEIAEFTPDELPHRDHSIFMHYCALRRRDYFVRVQLKDFGWEHHFKAPAWFTSRARQVLDKS